MIKFVRGKYSCQVHEHLAAKGLAPKLLHFQGLLCSWKVVIMEYIRANKNILFLDWQICLTQVKTILAVLAEEKYVRGDLRTPNLVYNDTTKTIMVLEYDISGREGSVVYPFDLNMIEIQWPEGVGGGGQEATPEHDKVIFQKGSLTYQWCLAKFSSKIHVNHSYLQLNNAK